MRFLSLILKNIKRNTRRSILTILGLTVSLFLFSSLSVIVNTLDKIVDTAGSDLILMVQDKTQASHATSKIPESYINRIQSLPHICVVSPVLFSMGTYKTSRDVILIVGVDPQTIKQIKIGGIRVDEAAFDSFVKEKRAALVGEEISQKHNWDADDSVWFKDLDGSNMNFIIKGSIPSEDIIVVHLDYLQEITKQEGIITNIFLKVDRLSNTFKVASEIDLMFANHSVATKTQSWKAFMRTMVRQMDGIKIGISLIALVIIIASLAGTANSIAMSVRERTREIGILKTLGFRKKDILKLIIGESTSISMVGGLIGCLLSYIFLISLSVNLPIELGPVGGELMFGMDIIVMTIGVSILIGLLGGVFPGYLASRQNIVETLRQVG